MSRDIVLVVYVERKITVDTSRSAEINTIIPTATKTGLSNGNKIRLNVENQPAPATRDAS